MNKVIIFGGTTEGKQLACELASYSIPSIYLVATEYGKMVLEDAYGQQVDVRIGRLDAAQMQELFDKEAPAAIVDATHPYAELVKKEIEKAREEHLDIPFYRILRKEEQEDLTDCQMFDNARECAKALLETNGKIFLTTGSKELPVFCSEKELLQRLVVRVIPNNESLKICYDCGLAGNQIIAMQGPFSKEMNLAFFKDSKAQIVVLKESGKAGGELERIQAAREAGAICYIIKRPAEKATGEDYSAVKKQILSLFGIHETGDDSDGKDKRVDAQESGERFNITLAGFGMGNGSITIEVQQAINEADMVFGASRMIEAVDSAHEKYPYYLASDIIPVLEKKQREMKDDTKVINVVILFSGDTGFYSGAAKMYQALTDKGFKPHILPGISSVSSISARAACDWQDASVISTHGVEKNQWLVNFITSVTTKKKTIAITSGVKDVNYIGEILSELEANGSGIFKVITGFNMYGLEKVQKLSAKDCMTLSEEGLYSLIVLNEEPKKNRIVPGLHDDEFIRDKVPMTKEEIRSLSICKLGVCDGDVVYDIGGGTGSVSVELALLSPGLRVFSIEKKPEAAQLIRKNAAKFLLKNIEVIEGTAPEALSGLPEPDKVFIGGSTGNMRAIFETLKAYGKSVKVVANAVTLETIAEINELTKEYGMDDVDITQVQISKSRQVGNYSLMEAGNPVYIVTFHF